MTEGAGFPTRPAGVARVPPMWRRMSWSFSYERGPALPFEVRCRLAPDVEEDDSGFAPAGGLLDSGPVLGDPAGDAGLVALHGAADGALHAPAQPQVQHRPQVPRVVAHPGHALDHLRDARQGPQLAGEPVRAGTFQQGLLDPLEVSVAEPRPHPGRPLAGQCGRAVALPGGMPAAGALLGHPQGAGDLGRTHVLGEQLGRLEAAGLPAGALGAGAGAGSRSIGTSDRCLHASSGHAVNTYYMRDSRSALLAAAAEEFATAPRAPGSRRSSSGPGSTSA